MMFGHGCGPLGREQVRGMSKSDCYEPIHDILQWPWALLGWSEVSLILVKIVFSTASVCSRAVPTWAFAVAASSSTPSGMSAPRILAITPVHWAHRNHVRTTHCALCSRGLLYGGSKRALCFTNDCLMRRLESHLFCFHFHWKVLRRYVLQSWSVPFCPIDLAETMLCHAEDVHSKSYKGEGMLNQFAQHIVHHSICLAYSFPCSILQLKVKRCKLCKHHGLFLVWCHIDILQAILPILYERPTIKTKPSNKPTCGPYYLNWIWFQHGLTSWTSRLDLFFGCS